MREITEPSLVNHYLEEYHICDWFQTDKIPLRLYEYEPGELMNSIHPCDKYLKWIVKGKIRIHVENSDGDYFVLYEGGLFGLYGDMEFCGYQYDDHWHYVVETVHSIEINLDSWRSYLWQDQVFLRHIMLNLADECYLMTIEASMSGLPIRDRILYYLKGTPSHSFARLDAFAMRMHCSKRQLQRILNDLIEEGLISKGGRGFYFLNQ